MRKIIITSLLLVIYFNLVACSTQEVEYDHDTKVVTCTSVTHEVAEDGTKSDSGFYDIIIYVEDGIVTKVHHQLRTPHSYYENHELYDSFEQALDEAVSNFENTEYHHEGITSLKPYDDGEYLVDVMAVVDYTDLSYFSYDEVAKEIRTKDGKKVIFDLFWENLMTEENQKLYTCQIDR